MQLNTLKPKTKNKTKRQVGRGGKRGGYSGRGIKGQKSRAGRRMRPEARDIIKKIPKKRGEGKSKGYRYSITKARPAVVNVGVLNNIFEANAKITPKLLLEHGAIEGKGKIKTLPVVKILGDGKVDKKLIISGCVVSKKAKVKIEKAGGNIE